MDRYEEALERAKKELASCGNGRTKMLERIFPELAESEDEKIRKRLISYFKSQLEARKNDSPEVLCTYNKWIVWLERQGEQSKKHDVCDTCDEKDSCISPCCVKLVEEQGGQKPVGFNIGDEITVNGQVCMVVAVDNPAWSEEDEDILNTIINHFKVDIGCTDEDDMVRWLKSIKDRVPPQSKLEWCEEDEEVINLVCSILYSNFNENENFDKNQMCIGEIIDKLESLKERCTWKPSDLPRWKKGTLPNDNTTGFNSDYFCHNGYNINYKELFEKLPKDD